MNTSVAILLKFRRCYGHLGKPSERRHRFSEETIAYDIPTFKYKNNLIHFGVFKSPIGVYPVPRNVAEFKEKLAGYGGSKSTMQLPFDKPLPLPLIAKIVKHNLDRIKENTKSPRTGG